MTYRQLIFVFLFLGGITSSGAIWCFICTNFEVAGCGDVFRLSISDSNHRSWCDGSCVKRRGERYSGSVRRVEISRSCTIRRSEGCYDEEFNNINVKACLCNTDDCNSSSKLTSVWVVIVLSVIAAAVWNM